MEQANKSTPLLLNKKLTAILQANQSPQLPTLLLTTSQGKLLAHASPHPVSVLRTHATVAGSLLTIHTSSSSLLPGALPGAEEDHALQHDDDEDDEDAYSHDEDDTRVASRPSSSGSTGSKKKKKKAGLAAPNSIKPVTITVQLSRGTVVIRRLKCGLLFVCIGPSAVDGASSENATEASAAVDAAYSEATVTTSTGSPDNESLVSTGGQTTTSMDSAATTSVVTMRRHAADLARWLDNRLSTLKVPEESVA